MIRYDNLTPGAPEALTLAFSEQVFLNGVGTLFYGNTGNHCCFGNNPAAGAEYTENSIKSIVGPGGANNLTFELSVDGRVVADD